MKSNRSLLEKPLRVPKEGEKVYELTNEQVGKIEKRRSKKDELEPGMGGVSPRSLDEQLGEDAIITSVDFAVTKACNMDCGHCYLQDEELVNFNHKSRGNGIVIPFDTIAKVTEEAFTELGVKYFVLTGGEPTMYRDGTRDITDVIDLIKSFGNKENKAEVFMFSNVSKITPRLAEQLAERKVGLCLKQDSLDREVQEAILGVPGTFDAMQKGYENLWAAGYGQRSGLTVSVNQVIRTHGGIDTLKGSVDLGVWIREHGMFHSMCPVHYCGQALDDSADQGLNVVQTKALYDIMATFDTLYMDNPWEAHSTFPEDKTCNRPGRGVHIRSTGEVTSCSECPKEEIDGTKPYVFGNVNYGTSLKEMASSAEFRKLKAEFGERNGDYICNDACDMWVNELCRGGCATRSAFAEIDPNTLLSVNTSDRMRYSQGGEDPNCPAWAVLAQKQGALKEGLYESVVDSLLRESVMLSADQKMEIRDKVVGDFQALRGTHG